jgi:hypothetical protein
MAQQLLTVGGVDVVGALNSALHKLSASGGGDKIVVAGSGGEVVVSTKTIADLQQTIASQPITASSIASTSSGGNTVVTVTGGGIDVDTVYGAQLISPDFTTSVAATSVTVDSATQMHITFGPVGIGIYTLVITSVERDMSTTFPNAIEIN